MPEPVEIRMPQVNNNDETGVLQRWLVADGARVAADTVIAVIETSKASYDLMAEHSGVLQRLVREGEETAVGTPIAHVFAEDADREAWSAATQAAPEEEPVAHQLVITRSGLDAMQELGVTEAELLALGKRIIKRADVEAVAAAEAAGDPGGDAAGTATDLGRVVDLPRRQRGIAEVVSRSHREIPTAFTAYELRCDEALDGLARLARERDLQVGLPELLLHVLGRLRVRFPFFYGEVVDERRFREGGADLGVTVDVGTGLFIPVVRAAEQKSLAELADLLMDFRIKALRESFSAQDLTGGALTLSLNNEEGVLLVEPLILPGQSCMVSLGGVRLLPALDPGGNLVARRVVTLGLAYDHRVINGAQAVAFLQATQASLCAPLDELLATASVRVAEEVAE